MTDYNDGKWHGWNGEQEHPPIDPKSVVEVRYSDAAYDGIISAEAGRFLWGTMPNASIVAFRVTKPAPPKPREWWAVGRHLHETEADALAFRRACADLHGNHHLQTPIIHVCEVLE